MSAIGGKADVRELPSGCPLIARSGHSLLSDNRPYNVGDVPAGLDCNGLPYAPTAASEPTAQIGSIVVGELFV